MKRSTSLVVVKADFPLLLGNTSLNKSDAVLFPGREKAIFMGTEVTMKETSTGHFSLRIDKPIAGIEFMKDNLGDKCFVTSEVLEEDCLVCNAEVTDELSLKDIKKLHQCFGHVSSRKLGDLIKDAGKLTDDVREKLLFVKNNCRSCVMNQNSKPRPAVALPRASKFQDVLSWI